MNSLIRMVTRWPRSVIAVLLVLSLPFGYGFFHKSFFNAVTLYFDADDPSMVAYKRFQQTYGNEETAIIALHARDLFANRPLDIIRQISTVAKNTPGIQRVFSLTEATEPVGSEDMVRFEPVIPRGVLDEAALQAARQHALRHEVLTRTLLSEDGTTTAILLELAPHASAEEKGRILNGIAAQARNIAGNDVSLHFSGTPYVEYEINNLTQHDDRIFTPLTLVVIFLLSAFFLGKISLAALCLVNILLTIVWAVGFYDLTGHDFNMVTVVMPPILLAIAVADGIHILTHFVYNHHQLGKSRFDAAVLTAKRLWLPCLFTSLTTGVGFLSFVTAAIGPVRTLGLYTFIGVMIAFFITITMLPALLVVLPLKSDREMTSGRRQGRRSPPALDLTRVMVRIGRINIDHYKGLGVLLLLITIVALVGACRLRYETNFVNHLKASNPVKQGIRFIEDHLFGTVPVVLLIRARTAEKDFSHPESLALLDKVQTDLKKEFKGVYTSFFSIVDYMKEIHRAFNQGEDRFYAIPDHRMDILDYYELAEAEVLNRIVSPDRMEARISFSAYLGPIDRSKRLQTYLKAHVEEMIGGDYAYQSTGTSTLYVAMDGNLRKSQTRSFTSAFVIILLMMYFVCRNIRLTIISMLPNIFPIVCTFGLMGFLDIPLDVSTILIASVTIGIAVDDTIHFVVWYRRNLDQGMPVKEALGKTFQDTGQPILVTSVLLALCFFLFITGSVKPVQAFGLLTGLAMVFALVGDLFVLPILILVFQPGARRPKDGPSVNPVRGSESGSAREHEPVSQDRPEGRQIFIGLLAVCLIVLFCQPAKVSGSTPAAEPGDTVSSGSGGGDDPAAEGADPSAESSIHGFVEMENYINTYPDQDFADAVKKTEIRN